jgi:hypothetical protein
LACEPGVFFRLLLKPQLVHETGHLPPVVSLAPGGSNSGART